MNCECIIVHKNNRRDENPLLNLADDLRKIPGRVELFPVAISRITQEVKGYRTYDEANGYRPKGKRILLNPDDEVLFVAGKYHWMNKSDFNVLLKGVNFRNPRPMKDFEILFVAADTPDFFQDIITIESEA